MLTLYADIEKLGCFILEFNGKCLFTNITNFYMWADNLIIYSYGWERSINEDRFGPLLTTFDPATFDVSTLSVYTKEYIHEHFPEFFI